MNGMNTVVLWTLLVCVVVNSFMIASMREDSYKPSDEIQIEEVCVDDYKMLLFVRNGQIVGIIHDPREYMEDVIIDDNSEENGVEIY